MAILANELDPVGFHGSADERIDIVVANLAHQAHLLHRLAANLVSLGEHEFLGADDGAAVSGHVGEELVDGDAR